MQAFHNDPAIKQMYLDRIAAHREADELIRGIGFENGRGCAIGCTFNDYNHSKMQSEWDVPEMIARLEDTIFEGLPLQLAMEWPERLTRAIKVGSDLSLVGWKFQHWLLTRSGIGSYDHPLVCDVVAQCAAVLEPLTRGLPVNESAASAARSAASAAWSVESAASAASVEWSAASAARSAESAAIAARCAASAVRSAARSAASAARSAASAVSVASAAYTTMADQLILLIEAA